MTSTCIRRSDRRLAEAPEVMTPALYADNKLMIVNICLYINTQNKDVTINIKFLAYSNLMLITSTLQSSAPCSLKIKFKMNLVDTKTTILNYMTVNISNQYRFQDCLLVNKNQVLNFYF